MAKRAEAGWRRLRRYTEAEREAVVREAAGTGVSVAARKHGVPESCVSRWVAKSRAAAAMPVVATSAVEFGGTVTPQVALSASVKEARPEATPNRTLSTGGLKLRVAKSYTPSQKAEILEHAGAHGVIAASKKFGASRFSIYDWQRRVAKASVGDGPSPTSGPAPSEVEAQRDKEILDEWHRHPGLGPSQIRNQLRRKSVKVSVHTVRRVMQDAGYRPPKVERKPHDERFEAVRPNHLWHLDFVHRNIHRANTFTLILIDDHSRFVVGHGVDEAERADFVIAAFEEAVERHGKPEMVMHDKGSAFWSWRGVSRFMSARR